MTPHDLNLQEYRADVNGAEEERCGWCSEESCHKGCGNWQGFSREYPDYEIREGEGGL